MIYCVSLHEVEEHLRSLSFERLGQTEETLVYEREGLLVTLRNVASLPEMLMNNAFYAAGLDPPDLRTFWCD